LDKADKALRRRTAKVLTVFFLFVGVFAAVLTWWLFASKISIVAIRGESMEPALSDGQNVILKQEKAPEPSSIIIFDKPRTWDYMGTGERVLIKRIAVVPQETLTFDGKAFYVDGQELYNVEENNYECAAGEVGYEHKLTQQEVFVMGDNALKSLDSRRIFCDGHPENAFIGFRNVVDFGTIERIF
jgi:signal peptidase I